MCVCVCVCVCVIEVLILSVKCMELKLYNLIHFDKCMHSCNHSHNQYIGHFHCPRNFRHVPFHSNPPATQDPIPSPLTEATIYLISITIDYI